MLSIASNVISFVLTLFIWLLIALVLYVVFTFGVRALTRRLPGELDDLILSATRKPLLALVLLIGVWMSAPLLALPDMATSAISRLLLSAIIVVALLLAYRIIRRAVLPLAERRAHATETRVDDVAIGISRLVVPVVALFAGLLLVLTVWDVDIGAALAGAGLISLVLGLALQDTLANIFAGISLLADAPFTPGEVIMLPDGKVCRVERIGLRATALYYIADHAIIFVPNKELANAAIINIFKPSYDVKASLDIGVAYASDIRHVSEVLLSVAQEHPNVLMSNLPRRVQLLEACLARSGDVTTANAAAREHRDALQAWLPKLHHEIALHTHIEDLEAKLLALANALKTHETGGLNRQEVATLQAAHVQPIAQAVQATHAAMQTWSALTDPQALPNEAAEESSRWGEANARLLEKWASLERALTKPQADHEMQLDTQTSQLCDWLLASYKATREPWKDPHVIIKSFGASSIDLQLKYFVDDVRLEHFERPRRVATELMIEIHERFKALNIEIPFPQQDVWLRGNQKLTESTA